MVSLVRSGLLRMITFVVVSLPLCMLVSRVYIPYSSGSSKTLTFGLSFVEPVQSPHEPVQPHELPPVNKILISGTSVLGGPSLSPDFMNQVLSTASSPASGTGQALYDLSVESGIDDAYALAVFGKESSFGKYGAGFDDHALGNIVCAGYSTCNGRFRWYLSWEAGYQDFYQLIKREYVARGLSTVEAITPVYAPSSENNTELYIQQVRQSMLAFRQAQSLSHALGGASMGTVGLLALCLVAGIVLVGHARLRHLGLSLLAGVVLACLVVLVFHIPLVV